MIRIISKVVTFTSFLLLTLFSTLIQAQKNTVNHLIKNNTPISLGVRPFFLIDNMEPSQLKNSLLSCEKNHPIKSDFSIGHRGAPLQFPEHTKESYLAAARQGAGIIECDVTFTKDRQLVCRHSQCDLHTTTNILMVPELAKKCTQVFQPADPKKGTPAQAQCCTSDITLAEFKSLQGKMDGYDPMALTISDYMAGTADFRTDLYAHSGTLMSLEENIQLLEKLGVKHTPELKSPMVKMPFQNEYTQQAYAQQLINTYKKASVNSKNVWLQSFNPEDLHYWIKHEPEFAQQAILLDDKIYKNRNNVPILKSMKTIKSQGINNIAPPIFALLKLDHNNHIIPSAYAKFAKQVGLNIITWSLERSASLQSGGGFYYQTIKDAINKDGDVYEVLHVLHKDVGVKAIFSDWPATVTYYANCFNIN